MSSCGTEGDPLVIRQVDGGHAALAWLTLDGVAAFKGRVQTSDGIGHVRTPGSDCGQHLRVDRYASRSPSVKCHPRIRMESIEPPHVSRRFYRCIQIRCKRGVNGTTGCIKNLFAGYHQVRCQTRPAVTALDVVTQPGAGRRFIQVVRSTYSLRATALLNRDSREANTKVARPARTVASDNGPDGTREACHGPVVKSLGTIDDRRQALQAA